VDVIRLGLELSLVRFPGDGQRQAELLSFLKGLPGVVRVIETAHARDLVALLVTSDASSRRALRARIEEFSRRAIWDEVTLDSHDPEPATWRTLVQAAAALEGLTL
jgi:hypothetical protein